MLFIYHSGVKIETCRDFIALRNSVDFNESWSNCNLSDKTRASFQTKELIFQNKWCSVAWDSSNMYGVHESVIKLFSNKQTAHQKSRNESHKFLTEKAIKKSQHKKTHQSQGLTNKMFFFHPDNQNWTRNWFYNNELQSNLRKYVFFQFYLPMLNHEVMICLVRFNYWTLPKSTIKRI